MPKRYKLNTKNNNVLKCVLMGLLALFLISLAIRTYNNVVRRHQKQSMYPEQFSNNSVHSVSSYGGMSRDVLRLLNTNNLEHFEMNNYGFLPTSMSGELVREGGHSDTPLPSDSEKVDLMGESLGQVKEGLEFRDPDTDHQFNFGNPDGPQVIESGPYGTQSA